MWGGVGQRTSEQRNAWDPEKGCLRRGVGGVWWAHLVTVSTAAGSGGVGGKEERRETAGDRDRLRPGVQVPKGAASQTAVV